MILHRTHIKTPGANIFCSVLDRKRGSTTILDICYKIISSGTEQNNYETNDTRDRSRL